jgi:hypothetical protein
VYSEGGNKIYIFFKKKKTLLHVHEMSTKKIGLKEVKEVENGLLGGQS